jgi:hypothetical protein
LIVGWIGESRLVVCPEWPGGTSGIVGGRCERAGGLSLQSNLPRRLLLLPMLSLLVGVGSFLIHVDFDDVLLLRLGVVAPTVRRKRCCLCL